jgi:hypothetical protein
MPPRKVLLIGGAAVALLVAVVIVMRRRAAALEAADGSAAGMLPASLTSTEGERGRAASLGLVLPGSGGIVAGTPAAEPPASAPAGEQSMTVALEPDPQAPDNSFVDPWAYLTPPGETPLITSEPLPGYLYGPTEQNPDAPYVSPTLDLDQGIGSTIAAQTVPGPIAAAPPATGTFIASTPAETAAWLGYDDTSWAM